MEKIEIVANGFTLPAGYILGLSEEQASKREYALDKAGEGKYKTKKKVSFKVGETIEVESLEVLGKGRWVQIAKPEAKETIAEVKIEEKKAAKKAAASKKKEAKK